MGNKLSLKENPTLGDFQEYTATMQKERGFDFKIKITPWAYAHG